MFGGAAMIDNQLTYFQNVYEWNSTGWKEFTTSGPGPRNAAALIYDPLMRRTLLLGGVFENAEGFKIHFDVWSWNGKDWTLVKSDCPVKEPTVAYDTNDKRVLVYGEVTNKNKLSPVVPREFELWEFKDDRWKKLSADGPDVYSMLAFDDTRNTLIIPSLEEEVAVVWEWANNTWRKMICSGECPQQRGRQAVAYHPGDKVTYMFGGRDNNREYLNDFWKWDGIRWARIGSTGVPDKRASAQLVYANNELLLYGGSIKGRLSNEVWRWKDNTWKKLE